MAAGVTALVWTPDFQIGVPELDRQHQFLCDLVNRFAEAVDRRENTTRQLRMLQNIMEFLRLHDAAEEALMREAGYAAPGEHAREHQEALEYLKRQYECMLRNEAGSAGRLRDHLVAWCRHHIGEADQGGGPARNHNGGYAKIRLPPAGECASLDPGAASEAPARLR